MKCFFSFFLAFFVIQSHAIASFPILENTNNNFITIVNESEPLNYAWEYDPNSQSLGLLSLLFGILCFRIPFLEFLAVIFGVIASDSTGSSYAAWGIILGVVKILFVAFALLYAGSYPM
jgi:hypothetical protein